MMSPWLAISGMPRLSRPPADDDGRAGRAAGAARPAVRVARPTPVDRRRAGRRLRGRRCAGARGRRRHRPGLGGGHRPRRRPAVEADDLVAQRVRFADDAGLAGYFTVDDELPADLELTRSVAAGELLPRGAVGTPAATGLVEVPIAVEPELVPPSVAPGDVVDVYVVAPLTAAPTGRSSPPPTGPALTGATVVAAPELASSFGTSGRRQLVLAVPEADAPGFFALLAQYDAPSLTVVRRG